MKRKRIYTPGGKYLRDAIHGDIFIADKFLAIIDCAEFQRLRRIKQLSVANMVYPSAEHTRFSHSIGTFHIMSLMIEHFEKQFNQMNLVIDNDKKDIALVAALLHDIGHGPFSHAYEDIHPTHERNLKHVDWSVKIITESNEINKVLKENFYDEFPSKVVELIKNQRLAREVQPEVKDTFDLFYVLSRLISSQIDADRMDYLKRDSTSSGVNLGNIDISRIIKSLRVTVINDKFNICVPEKYLTDIEQYLLGRYQMHKEVYLHSFKVEMEEIIKKIFKRVHGLVQSKSLTLPSKILERVFSDAELPVEDYVLLEDNVFLSAFNEWIFCDDKVLSELCMSLLQRRKFLKIEILNKEASEIERFKQEVVSLMKKYKVNLSSDFSNEYFWIEKQTEYSLYNTGKENIWILLSTGVHVDLAEISDVICRKDYDGTSEKLLESVEKFTFINVDILRDMIPDKDRIGFEVSLEQLINQYDNRNHVEIEKKYYFSDETVFDRIHDFIQSYSESGNRKLINSGKKYQEDTYYDTPEELLNSQNSTLRFRNKSGKYQLTLKHPSSQLDPKTNTNSVIDTQSVRFEHQIDNVSNNIADNVQFILSNSNLSEKDISNLSKTIVIKNYRTKFELMDKNVELEIVFDDVTYSKDSKEFKEYQLEIEVKSDYSHRTNLKLLTDQLESEIEGINITMESKYQRGLRLLK